MIPKNSLNKEKIWDFIQSSMLQLGDESQVSGFYLLCVFAMQWDYIHVFGYTAYCSENIFFSYKKYKCTV